MRIWALADLMTLLGIQRKTSTISWDLSRLRSNIIKIHIQNEFKYYDIGISKLILQAELLSKYTSSFTKNIIDDYLYD